METLPLEIIGGKILPYVFKDKDFCILNFFRYELISKYFHWVVNSKFVLDSICKIKNVNLDNNLSIIDLKKLIFERLYVHNFNIGYSSLPHYMLAPRNNYEDLFNNNTLRINICGKFDQINIKNKNNFDIFEEKRIDKNYFEEITILIKRHEYFEDMYAVYFNLNGDTKPLFWTNLDDYKISVLGVVY